MATAIDSITHSCLHRFTCNNIIGIVHNFVGEKMQFEKMAKMMAGIQIGVIIKLLFRKYDR